MPPISCTALLLLLVVVLLEVAEDFSPAEAVPTADGSFADDLPLLFSCKGGVNSLLMRVLELLLLCVSSGAADECDWAVAVPICCWAAAASAAAAAAIAAAAAAAAAAS